MQVNLLKCKFYLISNIINQLNSYNKQSFLNAQLQEKYLHLTQLYETESKLKWGKLFEEKKIRVNQFNSLKIEIRLFVSSGAVIRRS